MEQMKNEKVVEFDKYTDKDVLVDRSNIENSDFHYGTDNSFDKNVKTSTVFGKGEINENKKDNNKTYIKDKNTNFMEKIMNAVKNKNDIKKKENKIINSNNNNINYNNNNNNIINYNNKNFNNNNIIYDNENFLIKKESTEIDYFKENWDHLNKYKDIFQTKISDNNINYDYQKHFLNLNSEDSFDINNTNNNNVNNNNKNNNINNNNIKKNKDSKNNNILNNNNFNSKYSNNFNDDYFNNNNNINNNNYIPFSDSKCNIIQLGSSIKKYSSEKKSNYTSEYSLKNSIFKINENDDYSLKNSLNKTNENNLNCKTSLNKSQKILSSRNKVLNEFDIKSKKSYIKDKFYKNEKSSTCFTSLNTPVNKIKGIMEIIPEIHFSCIPFYSVRQKDSKEKNFNINNNGIKKENNNNNNDKNNKNILKKSVSEYKFSLSRSEKNPYLYNYIKELENKKDEKIVKKQKTNIIKVKNVFNKKENKNNKDNRNKFIKTSIQNIVIQ